VSPFVLQGKIRLPPDDGPSQNERYDPGRQLWVDCASGVPLVLSIQTRSSNFGETTLTETREGVDQSEMISTLSASTFGETSLSKTHEGIDQVEGTKVLASQFGETVLTRTSEGTDQSEVGTPSASPFGETMITATTEGVDQGEKGTTETMPYASYSHL
jgi:hypothetical protein